MSAHHPYHSHPELQNCIVCAQKMLPIFVIIITCYKDISALLLLAHLS